MTREFATNWWDGPAPQAGDVIQNDEGMWLVETVAQGAGIGHWRLWCRQLGQLIHLHESMAT